MSKLKKLLNLSILISILSIVVVLLFTVDSSTIDAILTVKYEYIVAAIALHTFSYIIWGMRTKVMCKALGHDITALRSIEIITSSTLVAAITPSSAGGEPARIHLLHQNKMPIGRATAVVIGERLMDAILLLSMLPFALYIFRDRLPNYQLDTALMVAEIVAISVLALMLYGMFKPNQTKKFIHFIVNRIAHLFGKKTETTLSPLLERIDVELEHFHSSIWMFLTEGKKGLTYGAICTVLFWIDRKSVV